MKQVGLTQRLDQLGATVRDFAPVVAAYYKGLVEAGVPPEHAVILAARMQDRMVGGQYGERRIDRDGEVP